MKIVALKTLRDFWPQHPAAEQALKARYRSASFLHNWRVVFNIKGNDFRLLIAVTYRFQAVYVKFVGTHAQSDAIDAETVEAGD
jgi:mRNA interferase HigB